MEVKFLNLTIIIYIQCNATYFTSLCNWWTSLKSPQVRGRLETLWANSERLEMLASKEPVARRQVEIYVRIRFTYYSAAVLLIFCIIYYVNFHVDFPGSPKQSGSIEGWYPGVPPITVTRFWVLNRAIQFKWWSFSMIIWTKLNLSHLHLSTWERPYRVWPLGEKLEEGKQRWGIKYIYNVEIL